MAAGAVSAPFIIPIIHPPTNRAKNHIDTNTPVSIQSETAGVTIFFTLDGSKPVSVRGQQGAAGSTKKYTQLITLPAGRVTVRAMAVTSDYRQSSVVTKVFSVELVDDGPSLLQLCSEGAPDAADGSCLRSAEASIVANGSSPPAGPRFLNQRFSSEPAAIALGTGCTTNALPEADGKLCSSQKSRLQPHVSFLQCLQCHSIHPSDPFAGFCAKCGAFISSRPAQRTPPAEGGQDHVVCVCCGTGNPAHISTCVTCENDLQQVYCGRNHSVPCGCQADGGKLFKSSCKQMNDGGAGDYTYKCGQVSRCVICWRCGASGSSDSLYCACCGVFLQAPSTLSSDITGGQPSVSHNAMWRAVPAEGTVKEAPPTMDQHTQTVGLYYPSATKLRREAQQEVLQLSREQASRDHRPPQSAVSPGRGFWRKQLDHVCAHLRSYAQNHASFRAVLGEPRLGRVVSAVVHEDGAEVSVTVSFESVKHKQQKVRPEGGAVRQKGGANTLSSATERSVDRGDGLTPKHIPQMKDWQLLEEVGLDCGSVSIVQELLDQGAEPSSYGSDGDEQMPWCNSRVGASWGGHQPAVDEEHGSAQVRR